MKKYSSPRSPFRLVSGSIIFALLWPTLPSSFFTIASAAEHVTLRSVVVVVGGTATPQDFMITLTGEEVVPNSFQGSAAGTTQNIPLGTFNTVDVAHVAQYKTTLSCKYMYS
jgi:type 1 fimbria pilin